MAVKIHTAQNAFKSEKKKVKSFDERRTKEKDKKCNFVQNENDLVNGTKMGLLGFFGRVGIKSKTDPHSCYKKFSEMQGKVEGEF